MNLPGQHSSVSMRNKLSLAIKDSIANYPDQWHRVTQNDTRLLGFRIYSQSISCSQLIDSVGVGFLFQPCYLMNDVCEAHSSWNGTIAEHIIRHYHQNTVTGDLGVRTGFHDSFVRDLGLYFETQGFPIQTSFVYISNIIDVLRVINETESADYCDFGYIILCCCLWEAIEQSNMSYTKSEINEELLSKLNVDISMLAHYCYKRTESVRLATVHTDFSVKEFSIEELLDKWSCKEIDLLKAKSCKIFRNRN